MPYPLVPLFDTRIRVNDPAAEPRPSAEGGDGPRPIATDRPNKSRRPHNEATIAATRRLIEETTLSQKEIATRTGVGIGTISRWMHERGWRRHPYAPVASDTLPPARAGRRLKLRMLGNRLHLLAERCATELWNNPAVDLDRLLLAMRLLRTARHDYMSHRRPRGWPDSPSMTGREWKAREDAIRSALTAMRRNDVRIDRVPDDAMALLDDTPSRRRTAARQTRT